jgi:hypothetical protein
MVHNFMGCCMGFTGYLKTKAATYICNKAPIAEKEYLRAKDSN